MEINPKAFEAFFNAQCQFKTAIKDSVNPHFKSRFADFASVWDVVSKAMHDNGLIVTQPVQISDAGFPIIETVIRYKDGTVVERSQCPVICKVQNDPQAMGSAITYARRYSLASTLCVVTDDDDGNSASTPPPVTAKQSTPVATGPSLIDKWVTDIDRLPKEVDKWTTHMKALKPIGGGKGEFDKLKLKAATVGFYFDTDKKVFTTMESFKPA